jgi:hypothetical protein
MCRIYEKIVNECQECPDCKYIHSDGEGESCPYTFYRAFCKRESKELPYDLMYGLSTYPHKIYNEIPKRKIPSWCTLKKL